MIFHTPAAFFLFLAIPLIWLYKRKQIIPKMQFSNLSEIIQASGGFKKNWDDIVLNLFRIISFILIVTALARPQSVSSEKIIETDGIDIMLAMDVSGSMKAMDFQPDNRMRVAKDEAKRFVSGRKNDRIGLVVFARQSYTQCPLTVDYEILKQLIEQVQIGLVKDGTAIGLGIANAINRLRDSTAKSKVIILITDGANNAGNIDPITAAELALTYNIKIYAIAVGKEGLVPMPFDDPLFGRRTVMAKSEIDTVTLQKIASMTGGRFFHARDEKSLTQIYEMIDKLEKSKVEVKEFSSREELFRYFLFPALALILLCYFLQNTVFIRIP